MQRIKALVAIAVSMAVAAGCASKSAFPPIDSTTLTDQQRNTLASLKKLNDHPVYTMTYHGDYTWLLDLKKKYCRELGLPSPKCTTFAAMGGAERILGHNSDGVEEPILLLYTAPPNGYRAVTIVHLGESFGFSDKATPFDTPDARNMLLYTPYFQNTGMNEAGLAFAVMADPTSRSSIDPAKDTLIPGEAQRYCLDHAKNVDEALAFLSSVNVSFGGKMGNHWLFADATGKTALVEWVAGKMQVTRSGVPWQAAANFTVYGSEEQIAAHAVEYAGGGVKNDINGKSYWRYLRAVDALEHSGGSISMAQAMELLREVSLAPGKEVWFPTQYSVVYDLRAGEVWLCMDRRYEAVLKPGAVTE